MGRLSRRGRELFAGQPNSLSRQPCVFGPSETNNYEPETRPKKSRVTVPTNHNHQNGHFDDIQVDHILVMSAQSQETRSGTTRFLPYPWPMSPALPVICYIGIASHYL